MLARTGCAHTSSSRRNAPAWVHRIAQEM